MVSFCPLCRLSIAFSRQVFPVSGSEGQREGQNQARIGRRAPSWEASPHRATFEFAVSQALLALLQKGQQALQLLAVTLSHGIKDAPTVVEPGRLLDTRRDRVLGCLPGK